MDIWVGSRIIHWILGIAMHSVVAWLRGIRAMFINTRFAGVVR